MCPQQSLPWLESCFSWCPATPPPTAPHNCPAAPLLPHPRYGMKTGESISDTVAFKEFVVSEVLEEITKLGFMSDWHPMQKEVEAYQAENGGSEDPLAILVVRDFEEKYGDNFYLCTSLEAKDAALGHVRAAQEAKEAAEEAARLAEEAAAAAEFARLNAVFVDVPLYSKPYVSETSTATTDEISNASPGSERQRLVLSVTRLRSTFGKRCPRFGPRDSESDPKQVSHQSVKNPDFDQTSMLREVGLQTPGGMSATVRVGTQTPWFRKVAYATQYDGFDPDASSLLSPQPQAKHGGQDQDEALAASQTRLLAFLGGARMAIEEALQQNENVDVFRPPFSWGGAKADDDARASSGLGTKGDNYLKEVRTFNDMRFSRAMSLAAIDWHPRKRGLVAVSPMRNLNFEERMSSSGRPFSSNILLWDFTDLIHPALMLEGPHEMSCFRFNRCPGQSNLVAAGCVNGQVVLFDASVAMAKHAEKQGAAASSKAATRRKEGDGASAAGSVSAEVQPDEGVAPGMQPVPPLAVSVLEGGHRRGVADLAWLPADAMVDARGRGVAPEHRADGRSYQFMTLSGDGQCLVWDTRFARIAAGDLPHILKVRGAGGDKKKHAQDDSNTPWLPLFKMDLKRPGQGGDLSLCKLAVLANAAALNKDASGAGPADMESAGARPSSFLICTEEGELALADWNPPSAETSKTKKSSQEDEDGGGGAAEAPEYVSWVAQDHARPCRGLEPNPAFPGLILSVGEKHFTLWSLRDSSGPIFSSPQAATDLTCGKWSPTRPGVLYVGRDDGCVDIWDLTDSSYRPTASVTVSSKKVTSLEFLMSDLASANGEAQASKRKDKRPEQLAVGDVMGNLHVFDMPWNLTKPAPLERAVMEAFIARESKRVAYAQLHAKGTDDDDGGEGAGDDDDGGGAAADAGAAGGDGGHDHGNGGSDEEKEDPAAVAFRAEQKYYRDLEMSFIEELGLSEKELPDLWRKTKAVERAQQASAAATSKDDE